MNNKGQALILFVLLLPLVLVIFTGVIEIGHILVAKKDLASTKATCLKALTNECFKEAGITYKKKQASKQITGLIYKYKLTLRN